MLGKIVFFGNFELFFKNFHFFIFLVDHELITEIYLKMHAIISQNQLKMTLKKIDVIYGQILRSRMGNFFWQVIFNL